jgi:hypothetical protein
MRTLERTVGLLGPTLSLLLRATRRVTLIIASLAVAVTACGPVGVASPPGLPGSGDPTEDIADNGPAPEADDDYDPSPNCYPGMPPAACVPGGDGGDGAQEAQPEGGADDNSPGRRTVPAPDCGRAGTGPMVPC